MFCIITPHHRRPRRRSSSSNNTNSRDGASLLFSYVEIATQGPAGYPHLPPPMFLPHTEERPRGDWEKKGKWATGLISRPTPVGLCLLSMRGGREEKSGQGSFMGTNTRMGVRVVVAKFGWACWGPSDQPPMRPDFSKLFDDLGSTLTLKRQLGLTC